MNLGQKLVRLLNTIRPVKKLTNTLKWIKKVARLVKENIVMHKVNQWVKNLLVILHIIMASQAKGEGTEGCGTIFRS